MTSRIPKSAVAIARWVSTSGTWSELLTTSPPRSASVTTSPSETNDILRRAGRRRSKATARPASRVTLTARKNAITRWLHSTAAPPWNAGRKFPFP
jgi:hypothetical protein